VPYPDFVQDPSLGMPHLFYQVQNRKGRLGLIAPEPYNTEHFVTPSWFTPSSRPR
jgi:branched-chain amino acid transport system substrate-binding protein